MIHQPTLSELGNSLERRMAHTPGPWLYRPEEFDDWGTVRAAPDEQGRMWAICRARDPRVSEGELNGYRANKTDPYEANARLIASAPDQNAALNYVADMTCIDVDGEWHFKPGYDPQVVLDAIAKAEGLS